MTQLNDVIILALEKEGYGNQLNDAQAAWLQSVLLISVSNLNTLWNLYWGSLGIGAGAFNDRYQLWLTSLGYTQPNLNDQKLQYWTDRSLL